MPGVIFRRLTLIAAALAAFAAVPAAAQFNDGYNFLKAVKDRDGTKVTQFLDEPGSTLVNTSDQTTGETALHIVVRRRDETWTRFLLDHGANPNKADKRGETPMAIAANFGFVEGVEALVKRGGQVDVADAAGDVVEVGQISELTVAGRAARASVCACRTESIPLNTLSIPGSLAMRSM